MKFVKFVHTDLGVYDILNIVKTPPIHYIVFATPIRRNTFSKKDSVGCPFYVLVCPEYKDLYL